MKSLTTFYRDLQAWINEGCPVENDHHFRKDRGLCANLDKWCMFDYEMSHEHSLALDKELEEQFIEAGLNAYYPFNKANRIFFKEECDNWTMFENPERLAWIKNHCND